MVKSSNQLNSKFYFLTTFTLQILVFTDARAAAPRTIHNVNVTYPDTSTNSTRSQRSMLRFDLEGKNENISNTEYQVPKDPFEFLLELETATVHGIRVEQVSKDVSYEKYVSVILANSEAKIRLFGDRFTKNTMIRFTTESKTRGMDCDDVTSTKSFYISRSGLTKYTATAKVQLPPFDVGEELYYICLRENNTDMPWIHQGTEQWILLKSYEAFLPLWSQIVLIVVLLLLSGLFSGLNLGLMSLDRTEMKIIAATGTDKERRYAKTIQPLRDNGNYLLCSLLLGNVMVNSTLTILLDDLSSGLIAVISSTLAIVIFGEIIPQALCSRHGLAVGARTVWLTKFFMALTFPLSYPISVLLDKILGEEIGNVYNRDRLKELIRVTRDYNDLERDEVNIIAGALELKQKTVKDVMTPLDEVFMLPTQAVLDFDTVSEIMVQGYSRIPVYEESRSNIVSLLYTKDLAFVDPDNKMPVRTICEFYHNPSMYVFESTTLDIIFRDFKQGNQGHMAFVQRIVTDDKGSTDPFYEVIGVITLEDVIEALLQAEIYDETDVWDNPRRRRSRTTLSFPHTPHQTTQQWEGDGIHVSPQLGLAAFQYLSTSVEEFNVQRISKTILQRLLSQNFFFQIKIKNKDKIKNDATTMIYEKGKPADYFVLILEGRVQSEIGKEKLMFESGPFTFFGIQSLNQNAGLGDAPSSPNAIRKFGSNSAANLDALLYSTFVPDYTVRAATDLIYLRISRSVYMAAQQATVLERAYSNQDALAQNQVGDHFQEQIDKMMNSTNIHRSKSDAERNQNYFQRRENPQYPSNEKRKSEIILTPNHLLQSSFDKKPYIRDRPSLKNSSNLRRARTHSNGNIIDLTPNHKRFLSESDDKPTQNESDGTNNRINNLRESIRSNKSNEENEDDMSVANCKL